MKKRIAIISMLICLLSGANVSAQENVTIQEAGVDVETIFEALAYISDNSVSPDRDGVIHIYVKGNVAEPVLVKDAPHTTDYQIRPGDGVDPLQQIREGIFVISNADIKKIAISSTSDTKHFVTIPSNSGSWYQDYLVKMANPNAELEVSNLTFTATEIKKHFFAWIVSTTSTGAHNTRTYFHNCLFTRGCHYQTNAIPASDISDTFEFDNNEWQDLDDYIFHIEGGTNEDVTTNLIFKNNHIEAFRAVAIKNVNYGGDDCLKRKWNVIFDNNVFYHLLRYEERSGISSAVSLFQNTGPLNGNYTFTNNIILGHFTYKGTDASKTKVCALLLQHGGGKYVGIADGSSFSISNNTLQCDVCEIGWKAEKGDTFNTVDITELVKNGEYAGEGQKADYSRSISLPTVVHMYPESGTPHDNEDLCHVCYACGEVVVQAKVSGHGGTFEYIDDEGQHDVNSAVATIDHNLYPDQIKAGANLFELQKNNGTITRNGRRLSPLKQQEFVITPALPGAFQELMLYGREPKDVTLQAESTDGNKTFHYTFTNDFKQEDRFTSCPLLKATFGFGSITISCTGLKGGDSAMFDVKNSDGAVIFVVTLSAEHSSKTVSGLQAGTYMVAPHNVSTKNWQWTYTMSSTEATDVTVINGEDSPVDYSVTKKSGVTVKHGENYKVNNFEPVGLTGTGTKEQQLDIYNGHAL